MIHAKTFDNYIELRFKVFLSSEQFKNYVSKIKTIKGREFVKENKESFWKIPISEKEYLKKIFKPDEIEWEEEIKNIIIKPKKISTDLTYINELLLSPYPFQAIGINYLCDIKKGMIADEMGLGKIA